jgi:hypothetical protein
MLGVQQQQQFRGLAGVLPGVATPQNMPWNVPSDDRSAGSFTSSCSVVTAGGSSFLPMLPNPTGIVSGTDALYVQMPGAAGMVGSSSPLIMVAGNNMLAPLQQQQVMMPANQAYLLQVQQQQQLQQQHDMQQQARLQALQLELQQQQNNVRAALRGMEQQQGISAPMGFGAPAAMGSASNSFEGYPLSAFNSAPAGFPVAAAAAMAGQPGINTRISAGSTPREDVSASFTGLQNGLVNSMANISIGGGINFASGTVIGPDNSGSNALGVSDSVLAAVGQQQQQQRGSGAVESWL